MMNVITVITTVFDNCIDYDRLLLEPVVKVNIISLFKLNKTLF